ncbi:MAG: branched-chain amino acid aminotransferase [Defluviitaleaceae bacterium]|nr:branched-chain amino acid aminotransferase [Defluviitaleaceae bacterium]MCL2262195.1 branched-chain amino acid aminotransferase [Defluviitaleaceae bacterium]
MMEISITKTDKPQEKPQGVLGFGRIFTDHMFLMDYNEEKGWHDARIVPYGNLEFSPASAVLHYGQETFEGMKAYGSGGKCYLFRPDMNAKRSNLSNVRVSIPQFPEDDYIQAVKTLVKLDADWIPEGDDSSLYIRPFFIANDPFLGVAISKTYLFAIILCPAGAYFGSLAPVGIRVEDEYVRAVRGGTGRAKTGGNYAASMAALARAQAEGCAQAMWLDGVERKYIEEVGTMNIFFKINGKIVTPALSESILSGVTRDSIITLCKDFNLTVEERPITIDELIAAAESGELEEIFGTGTAVVISPVNKLRYKGRDIMVGNGDTGETSRKLYDTLTAIQRGKAEDKFGWRMEI